MNKGSIKFLALGGCHTGGYPVGKSNGFIEITAKICGVAVDRVEVVSSIHLGHSGRVGAACANYRPDTLILQMGHFETTKPFLGGTVSRSTNKKGASSGRLTVPRELFNSRLSTLNWDIKNLMKQQLARFSSKEKINITEIRQKLDYFCDFVTSFDIPQVILLSPLPCADRVSLEYRLKLLEVFQEKAMEYGFVYLDVMNSLLASASGKDIYYDGIHLNKKGHALLGKLVAKCLMEIEIERGL